jgi:hypothetical protein
MNAHRMSPICANRCYIRCGSERRNANAQEAANLPHVFEAPCPPRRRAARAGGCRRHGGLGLKPRRCGADNMKVGDLTTFPGGSSRVGRCDDHCHVADRGDVELEALSTAQPRSVHYLHLGELVVPIADTVDGFRAEPDSASEFTDSELSGRRHVTKDIASGLLKLTGVDR